MKVGSVIKFGIQKRMGLILGITQIAWGKVRYKVLCSNGKIYHPWENHVEVLDEEKNKKQEQ